MKKNSLKLKSLPIIVRTMNKDINYKLYCDRVNKRISLTFKKINFENDNLKNNKNTIVHLYHRYDQYEVDLALLKKQIINNSVHYSSKKIDFCITSLSKQLNENNDFFGSICEINKKINIIKLKMNNLLFIIKKKEKNRREIVNKIKFYKKRLEVYELYLNYLYDREEYRKKYLKNKEKVLKK